MSGLPSPKGDTHMGRHSLRRLGTIPLIAGAAGSAVAALSLPAVAAPVGRLGCRAFRAAARACVSGCRSGSRLLGRSAFQGRPGQAAAALWSGRGRAAR